MNAQEHRRDGNRLIRSLLAASLLVPLGGCAPRGGLAAAYGTAMAGLFDQLMRLIFARLVVAFAARDLCCMLEADLLALEGETIALDLATCPPGCPDAMQRYTVLGFADAEGLKADKVDAVSSWPDADGWNDICRQNRKPGVDGRCLPVRLIDEMVAVYLRPRDEGSASIVKLVFSISQSDRDSAHRFEIACVEALLVRIDELQFVGPRGPS